VINKISARRCTMKIISNLALLTLLLALGFYLWQASQSTEGPKPQNTKTAAKPPESAILQIDPGGHKAMINDIVFTPDGRFLVSASNDKLIRVWDIETGKTVRTLRGQIEEGHKGKIYAMALSPDGQWLAAGGFLAGNDDNQYAIRLYDFHTGNIVALFKGHTNVVLSLAFSPDAHYLVSGSADFNAILWDVSQQRRLHNLQGHTDAIYAVAFTPDSKRVVTGSYDHSLRLWQVQEGQLIATLKGHTDKVYAVAISPQTGTIASGSVDHTIRFWNGQTGDFIKTLADQGSVVGSLTFSPDGRYLLSGCGRGGQFCVYVWTIPEGQKLVTYKAHDNIIRATAISPDGRWAATGGDSNQAIHIWSLRDGQFKQRLVGVGALIWAVGFANDGKTLAWGKSTNSGWQINDYGPLEYYLTLPTPTRLFGTPKRLYNTNNYQQAQDQWHDWTLSTRSGKGGHNAILEILHQNRTITSIERGNIDGYGHFSYTFTPDGQSIISGGGHGILTAYNREGTKLGDYIGHKGTVWALAVSPDGSLLASASDDQTVRLWNTETFENLLTLFHGNYGEWIAWTPSGHYTGSPNGDQMIGWQINRGVDKAADYITAAQMRDSLYRPDIVANTLILRSLKQALAQSQPIQSHVEQLAQSQPPQFDIIFPPNHSQTEIWHLPLELSIAANTNPVEAIEVYLNDELVITRGKILLPPRREAYRKTLIIPLEQGENRLRVVLSNSIGQTAKDRQIYFANPRLQQQ